MKSKRNKTIDIDINEGEHYLKECIKVSQKSNLCDVIDKTINGDTFEVLKYLPKESIDLIIVDPPYNLDKNFHGNVFKKCSDNDYKKYTISWVRLLHSLLKENGSMYVCCDWKSSIVIAEVLSEHFYIQNRITWQREKGRGSKTNWKNALEDIWFVTKSKNYTFNVDDVKTKKKVIAPYKVDGKPKDWEETSEGKYRNTYPSNFWNDISIPYWSMKENTTHPTQKPEKLIAKLILASTNEGDVILDPFLGSGTTSVTASKLKRHYVGIEQNPKYCIFTQKRLEMAKEDSDIQGYKNGSFLERNDK